MATSTHRQPAVFFGHGSPMNALEDNAFTRSWSRLGRELARPRAIVAISAHWFVDGIRVTAMEYPPTVHDFGGFPRALGEFAYPAPGDPALAAQIRTLLAPLDVTPDNRWGLDHGTWSVLAHVYPQADVPVVQVSMDATRPGAFHYDVGRRLAPLRDDNVLLVASGNVVHNLRVLFDGEPVGDPWAQRFEDRVRRSVEAGDTGALIAYERLGADARKSVPTPEHYLPLLYTLGARQPDDAVSFPAAGIIGSGISMLSVRIG